MIWCILDEWNSNYNFIPVSYDLLQKYIFKNVKEGDLWKGRYKYIYFVIIKNVKIANINNK